MKHDSLRSTPLSVASLGQGPFGLENTSGYQQWRDAKLEAYPNSHENLIVEVQDPYRLTPAETNEILCVSRKANMVIYGCHAAEAADKEIPRQLGRQFGLTRLDSNMLADDDGVTSLETAPDKSGRGYIPYSSRRLLWHTDGYYNDNQHQIRAFVLHCVRPAMEGGDNALLDHEIAYIMLRDANPEYIRALMEPDAMIIPANTEGSGKSRPAQCGPVFSVDHEGNLHMRYTARTRSIAWNQDPVTQEAVLCLERILNGDSPYVFRYRLAAGQGLLANNVLHNRTGFTDDLDKGIKRLIYRARYYDRIAVTGLNGKFRA